MAVNKSPVIKLQRWMCSPLHLKSLWVAEVLMLLLYCQRADQQQVSLPHLKAACSSTRRHYRCQTMRDRMAQKLGVAVQHATALGLIGSSNPRPQPVLLCSLEGLHTYAMSCKTPTDAFMPRKEINSTVTWQGVRCLTMTSSKLHI